MLSTVAHVSTVHRWDDARITRREIPSLCDAGYRVLWAVPADAGAVVDLPPAARWERLPKRSAWGRLLAMPWLVRRLVALDADIYHLHDPELLLVADALRRRTGALVVYDKHEYQRGRQGLKALLVRLVERLAIPLVDGLIVVDYAEPAAASIGSPPDIDDIAPPQIDVAVVPNYPVAKDFDSGSRPSQEGAIRMIYTGVVARERGLWMMLDVLEALISSGRSAKLVLVGICFRKEERDDFESALAARGLGDDVERIGWTRYATADEIAAALSGGHVGLMLMDPSYRAWSNIPTKFYEYMAAGVPFVCTAYPNWQAFVSGRGGTVADPHDAKAVADTIADIVDSRSTYRWLSESGKRAAQQYSWAHSEYSLRTLYVRLRARRASAGSNSLSG